MSGDKPGDGKPCIAAIDELGNVRLTDAQPGRGLDLGEPERLDPLADLPRERRLGLELFRVLETEVGKDVSAPPGH